MNVRAIIPVTIFTAAMCLLILAALSLAGCTTSSVQGFDMVLTTLHDDGCHTTVNLAVNAGAVNPGSGFQAQGSIDCPGKPQAVVSFPAPSPTNIKP